MKEWVQIIFGLLGGLAIFIYGMNMMSECLQKTAGERMKSILSLLTKNPVMGVVAGALTTAVLQSSSATTVMAIGFVSAGLMSLPQAVSIILGANIGTTVTAQIIAFQITDYIYVFIFAGFFLSFFSKRERIKNIGQTIFAFGLLFQGIEIMGDVMKPLADSPLFLKMMERVADIPVLGVGVGTLMTLVVQSSSATIAVLQNFASQPGPDGVTSMLGLMGAIPILLGDNIGTTITALLASVGQGKNARRTALAHTVFNLSGAVLFLFLLKPYTDLIQWISPKGDEIDVISRQIANAHTGFNLLMTIIWLPLIGVLVAIVVKLVPDHSEKTQTPAPVLTRDNLLLAQPTAALQLVSGEVLRCGALVEKMLSTASQDLGRKKLSVRDELQKRAEEEQALFSRIKEFLSALFAEGAMTEEQVGEGTELMKELYDIHRIATLCREVSEAVAVDCYEEQTLSKEARKDIRKSLEKVLEMYSYGMNQMRQEGGQASRAQDSGEADRMKEELALLNETMRKNHRKRVEKKTCSIKRTEAYYDILQNISLMGGCCINLAE